VFAKRAEELHKALLRGREWLGGMKDDLAERLAALTACSTSMVSVWAERPLPRVLSATKAHQATEVVVERPGRKDERQRETATTLPTVMAPVLATATLSPELPIEEIPTTLPEVSAPVHTVGSRAEVIFGRSEHIALARVRNRSRRQGGYRETPRRRIPITERDIPSLVEDEAVGVSEQYHQVLMPLLWDLLVAPTSQTSITAPARFAGSSLDQHTPLQPQLWEREMAQTRS